MSKTWSVMCGRLSDDEFGYSVAEYPSEAEANADADARNQKEGTYSWVIYYVDEGYVEESQCPAHQCGIACPNCGVVRECDCHYPEKEVK